MYFNGNCKRVTEGVGLAVWNFLRTKDSPRKLSVTIGSVTVLVNEKTPLISTKGRSRRNIFHVMMPRHLQLLMFNKKNI